MQLFAVERSELENNRSENMALSKGMILILGIIFVENSLLFIFSSLCCALEN